MFKPIRWTCSGCGRSKLRFNPPRGWWWVAFASRARSLYCKHCIGF